ncbi:5-methylcytosine restriction system specificity protein McrC [Amycolatopsis sp. NPDC003676]
MQIPIRNLWLLQFFASELFRTNGHRAVSPEDAPDDLPDLVARILADEAAQRLHRGLSVGFRPITRNERRVKGRINQLTTERHQLLNRGQVNCTYDEIVTDIPSNRLVRAALERAAILVPGEPRYRSLARQMEAGGVRGPCPRLAEVPHLRQQRLLQRDRTMLAAAELLLTLAIPTTETGDRYLPLPADDDGYLRTLFEHAAYAIYRHRLTPDGWKVKHGPIQQWDISQLSGGMRAVLPSMKLDIVLQHPNPDDNGPRRIVIDTKFTSVTKAGYYREATLKSEYLYQIYAYLMSQAAAEGACPSEGLMLHPVVDGHFDEEVVIQGRRIRFATVDLAASGRRIVDEFLLAL